MNNDKLRENLLSATTIEKYNFSKIGKRNHNTDAICNKSDRLAKKKKKKQDRYVDFKLSYHILFLIQNIIYYHSML